METRSATRDRQNRIADLGQRGIRIVEHRDRGLGKRGDRGQCVDDLMAEHLDEIAQRRGLGPLQFGIDID